MAKVQLAKYLMSTGTAAHRSEAKKLLEDVRVTSPDFAPAGGCSPGFSSMKAASRHGRMQDAC